MAEWSKNKVESSAINGGNEFTSDDILAVDEMNAMVNNSFYAVDFVEAMADAPDVSDIDGTGTPSVSLVSNGSFKKFKFSNLRGAQGLKGDTGDKGEKGDKGDTGATNSLSIGSVVAGTEASATITGTAPNQVLNLVLPKGDKGDKGDVGGYENTIQFNATINISSYATVDNTTLLDNPYINKILYPYYYNNIERMTIDNTFINTMNALEFGKEYEVTLDGIYTNFEVFGKLIKVPYTSDSSKYYTMYLITPKFSFIIYNNFDNSTNDESIYFYGKPHCYKNTDTIPLVTIKSIKL